jgi:hypothetical protein
MIIGLVAFVFRILQNLSIDVALNIDHYALEFAELLVPMVTFGNCLWGFVFLMVSDRWSVLWRHAVDFSTSEIVHDFFDSEDR